LDQVEGLTGCKSETINRSLLKCYSDPAIWQRLTERLVADYRIKRGEIQELSALLGQISAGHGTFHAPVHRFNQSIRPGRPRRSKLDALLEEWGREGRVPDRAQADLKRTSLARSRAKTKRRSSAVSKITVKVREQLKSRVEHVLRETVIVSQTGEFYRYENDQRI
jgi:hypothetical protein